MTVPQTLALIYAAFCAAVIGFQICLIAGAPWGRLTQGGTHPGALPRAGRLAAAASIFLLAAMALAVMSGAGLWPYWPVWTGWTALAVQVLSVVLNWITPSAPERRLWGPVTSVMLALACAAMLIG
ncbi:hypothetical protein [Flavimaricola marinus]|uniref:Uncharacterized protein n=1 Tax=Flavimaricola marinus TaxID=1819565 RepID=A0A238LFS6_9RHOB|nr:hypothetical protein [Flavimaricola marinus]SMY08468.1 hypothetical protein LOM8899_02620 [Flavimaricola marinus]